MVVMCSASVTLEYGRWSGLPSALLDNIEYDNSSIEQ